MPFSPVPTCSKRLEPSDHITKEDKKYSPAMVRSCDDMSVRYEFRHFYIEFNPEM